MSETIKPSMGLWEGLSLEQKMAVAAKVLATVDAGLVAGKGRPIPGHMCVEAAVCYALGLPHDDNPPCVARSFRALKIRLNDLSWSSPEARAKGMRRLSLIQLGSAGHLDEVEFAKRLAKVAVTRSVPMALRAAASVQKSEKHKASLCEAANRCEKEGTYRSAMDAKIAAANATFGVAYAVLSAASNAIFYAATAAYHLGGLHHNIPDVAKTASNAVGAADFAAAAAFHAGNRRRIRDEVLSAYAEEVVQILIEMKVPGCQWLPLTEVA